MGPICVSPPEWNVIIEIIWIMMPMDMTTITNLIFNNGAGYVEKDYGKSFPKGYVWVQTINFEQRLAYILIFYACSHTLFRVGLMGPFPFPIDKLLS